MPVTDYKLTIDSKDVNKVLKSVEGRFVKLEKAGNKSMKKVGSSGLSMGNVLSGAVGGAFVALAGAALNFGTQAVGAFANVIKGSVAAANQFDVTRRKFISIFEGREGEADAVMDFVSQRASKLGLDMNEALSLSRSFLPDVKGTEDPLGTIEDLLVGVRGLAEEDTFQGVTGARIAIDEAMSGSLNSLKLRFEFTKTELDIIRAAQAELGQVTGTVEGLNKVLSRRGFDIDALKGSFTQNLGEMQFALGKLNIEMGKPIADKMNRSMEDLNGLLKENSDDFNLIAASIGDVVGEVVDFVGSGLINFLGDIDPSKIQGLVDAFHRVIIQIEILSGITGEGGFSNKFLDTITWLLDKTAMLTERFMQLNAILGAFEEGGGLAGVLSAEGDTFTDKLTNVIKDSEKIKESFLQTSDALEEGAKKEAAYADAAEARKAAQEENTDAALAQAEAGLKAGDAADSQASALEKLGVSEEKLTDIQEESVKNLKARLDLEMKFSQERADLHRKSLEDIEDIERNHQQDILESGRELNRDSRDMAQKHTADRAGIEKDKTRKLLDVELQYQRQLQDIQRQTSRDLESAELSQDALAFVETLRQQEISEEEAGITKERAEKDTGIEFEQSLDDLQVAQELERQTLMQGYADRLEDLQLQLEQEFIEQQISDERTLEQQAITEQRRTDTQTEKEAERLQKLVEGLDAEVAAVVLAEAQKLESVETAAAQMNAALQSVVAQAVAVAQVTAARARTGRGMQEGAGLGSRSQDAPPMTRAQQIHARAARIRKEERDAREGNIKIPTPSGLPLHLPLISRATGGPVGAGQATIVGELGEELFIPPTSGSIIPNDQMAAFLSNQNGGTTSMSEINFQPTFQLSNPAVLSPAQAAQTQAIASTVATEMFTKVLGGQT